MNTVNFKFKNGDILEDAVTGLKGVVMVCAEYSTGCQHYGLLQAELKDGKMHDWDWIDSSRLKLVKGSAVEFKIDEKRPSGAFPSGPQG